MASWEIHGNPLSMRNDMTDMGNHQFTKEFPLNRATELEKKGCHRNPACS
jgi:hypothetical protein